MKFISHALLALQSNINPKSNFGLIRLALTIDMYFTTYSLSDYGSTYRNLWYFGDRFHLLHTTDADLWNPQGTVDMSPLCPTPTTHFYMSGHFLKSSKVVSFFEPSKYFNIVSTDVSFLWLLYFKFPSDSSV